MLFPVLRNTNDWLTNAFDDIFDTDWMPRMSNTSPAVNVQESDTDYEMDIAAPGLKKNECDISVSDNTLNVHIENKKETKEDDKKHRYLRREFSYSNYKLSFTLPDDADKENISAEVNDGILKVAIPKVIKKEPEKAERLIEVK